jgi:hypothetical protein
MAEENAGGSGEELDDPPLPGLDEAAGLPGADAVHIPLVSNVSIPGTLTARRGFSEAPTPSSGYSEVAYGGSAQVVITTTGAPQQRDIFNELTDLIHCISSQL